MNNEVVAVIAVIFFAIALGGVYVGDVRVGLSFALLSLATALYATRHIWRKQS